MPVLSKIQLGKAGLTPNFIKTLKSHFENHKDVKVSVLKGAERTEIKNYAQQIVKSMGPNYTARTIGFTINVKKWRKTKTCK